MNEREVDYLSDESLMREIHELATARLTDNATPQQQERLAALVCENEAARKEYVQYIRETSALRWLLGSTDFQPVPADFPSSVPQRGSVQASRGRQPVEDSGVRCAARDAGTSPRRRLDSSPGHPARPPGRIRVLRRWVLAAAVCLIASGVLVYVLRNPDAPAPVEVAHAPKASAPPMPAPLPPVAPARVGGNTLARWDGPTPPGEELQRGDRLRLRSGLVEIHFASQARVVLEGPAEMTIEGPNACRLTAGQLAAHVPDSAKGFQVQTPDGTVTDQGTEFGISVRTQTSNLKSEIPNQKLSSTQVHVFTGRVEVTPSDHAEQPPPQSEIRNLKSEILISGQAADISAGGIERLPAADPVQFERELIDPADLLVAEDFERYEPRALMNRIGGWRTHYERSDRRSPQAIHVSPPLAAGAGRAGQRVLLLSDYYGNPKAPNPTVRCAFTPPPGRELELRFDFRLADNNTSGLATTGRGECLLALGPRQAVWGIGEGAAKNRPLIPLEPGVWYQAVLTLPPAGPETNRVRLRFDQFDAGHWRRIAAYDDLPCVPPIPYGWTGFAWGFDSQETQPAVGTYEIDNFRVRVLPR